MSSQPSIASKRRSRHYVSVDIDIDDLNLDDDDIIDIAEDAGLVCYKPGNGLQRDDLDDLCDKITSRLWSPSDWEQLQNALANAVVIPRRRSA